MENGPAVFDQFSEHSTIRLCENLDDGLASVFGHVKGQHGRPQGPPWGPKPREEMGLKTKPNRRKSHGNRMEET